MTVIIIVIAIEFGPQLYTTWQTQKGWWLSIAHAWKSFKMEKRAEAAMVYASFQILQKINVNENVLRFMISCNVFACYASIREKGSPATLSLYT